MNSISTELFGFDITSFFNKHRYCVQKHCILTGSGKACINTRLAGHMAKQNSINKVYTDWSLLDNALRSSDFHSNEVLKQFAKRTRSYGLRYEIHAQLGKSFVLELIRNFRRFADCEKDHFQEKFNQYEKLFTNLFMNSEKSNPGNIYRLYDLLEGEVEIHSGMFKASRLFSLLFAFGHYEISDRWSFPKSISELVAKYQFFYELLNKVFESNAVQGFFKADYLKPTVAFATKLWNYYSRVCYDLFSVDHDAILHNPHILDLHEQKVPKLLSQDQQILHLKRAFTEAIYQNRMVPFFNPTAHAQSLIPFRSNFEATYHPFKHGESSHQFLQRLHPSTFNENLSDQELFVYVRDCVSDYLIMIKEIISSSEVVKIQPDQFTPGTIFKFQKKQSFNQKERTYQVIIRSYLNGVSYLLTCY
ncbi:MAG: hypothetical protein LW832_07340 [Parachlamydia sp.]|nr:hypothetical protein [Parachlamydia sp.]